MTGRYPFRCGLTANHTPDAASRQANTLGLPTSEITVADVFHRAALFRPNPVGAWTFWALLAAVLIGVPALLVRALRSTEADAPAD